MPQTLAAPEAAEKHRNGSSLRTLQKESALSSDLISGFWPPELGKNKCLWS